MDLLTAAANEFDGADLDALRDYCTRLEIEFHPNMNASTLRGKLTAALGEYQEMSGKEPNVPLDVPSRNAEIKKLVGYNLRATGNWDGRRRVIQLHRSLSHDNTTRPQFFAWGRLHCYVPFGIQVEIPYPIWNVLVDTSGQKLERKRKVDDEGRIYYKDNWIPTQRFMYSDLGDDPKTADRPTGERERIARLYDLTNGFENFSERQFRAMCLSVHVSPKKEWSPADMKGALMARCNIAQSHVDLSVGENEETVAA